MNSNRLRLLFIFVFCFMYLSYAQSNVVTYELKKGEAFDILMVTTKKESKAYFKEYREKAFPVAVEMGYSFLPGFKIAETVQGKFEPKGMILGKWKSFELRERFLVDIEARVPNFHELRKNIWSIFNVTYYEIQNDYSFQLDLDKVIVATACWKKENTQAEFDDFLTRWKNAAKKTNGTLKLELVNGQSPEGYKYNPDYMVIAQWDTQEDFDAFHEENLKMDSNILKDVNQFTLSK